MINVWLIQNKIQEKTSSEAPKNDLESNGIDIEIIVQHYSKSHLMIAWFVSDIIFISFNINRFKSNPRLKIWNISTTRVNILTFPQGKYQKLSQFEWHWTLNKYRPLLPMNWFLFAAGEAFICSVKNQQHAIYKCIIHDLYTYLYTIFLQAISSPLCDLQRNNWSNFWPFWQLGACLFVNWHGHGNFLKWEQGVLIHIRHPQSFSHLNLKTCTCTDAHFSAPWNC